MKTWPLALLLLALSICGPASAAEARLWDFRVYLDDSAIGSHRFSLTNKGEEIHLLSEANFEVKILFFSAYRYVHRAAERWRGDCLLSLDARTDDNGKQLSVSRPVLEGCTMSYAYWNPRMLREPRLLNAQTGDLEPVSIAALGEDNILVRGVNVAARRYRITGAKNPIELWYSPSGEWLALDATVDGGRRLRYRLEQVARP
ncbi:MAG: DUF6134 family protein [Burkholderiales bacterium]